MKIGVFIRLYKFWGRVVIFKFFKNLYSYAMNIETSRFIQTIFQKNIRAETVSESLGMDLHQTISNLHE